MLAERHTFPAPHTALVAALALALMAVSLGGCGSSSGGGSGSGLAPGTLAENPRTGGKFLVEANQGGQASTLDLLDLRWGRLVDLHAIDPHSGTATAEPLLRDLLVDPHVTSDGVDYLLEAQLASGRERLVVLHPASSAAFAAALTSLEQGLQPVIDKGLSVGELPPFTALPRNAALALRFGDLLDDGGDPFDATYPGTVRADTVRVLVDYPPSVPYEARVLPDPNHGDLVDGRFHSTRVLIDFAISKSEALASGLEVNVTGLPAALSTAVPNVGVRVPTQPAPGAGQSFVLRNLSGHVVDVTTAGPYDPGTPTLDVVRALRSGSGALGDPHNGFLPDDVPPSLLGVQAVTVSAVTPLGGARYLVDLAFHAPACAVAPRAGDAIELQGALLEVLATTAAPVAGVVTDVEVLQLSGGKAPTAGTGEHRTPFDASAGQLPECFLALSPTAGQAPAALVSPDVTVRLRFSEALDPASVRALETFELRDANAPHPLGASVVGTVVPNDERTVFAFAPSVALRHAAGASEAWTVHLAGGADGVVDLAGNALSNALPPTSFTLDPGAPAHATGSLALTFDSTDEDGDGSPELRGQVVFDLAAGELEPRAVTRLSSVVDASFLAPPSVQAWTPLFGFPEPLSPHGSRMMAVWRYHDLGLGLMDEDSLNLDVEGLAWQPEAAGLSIDDFPDFEISLAHGHFLPDEWVDPATGGIVYPNSGLVSDFAQNLAEPLTVVHPRSRGYQLQPLDTFVTAAGTLMAPWPLNRGIPQSEYAYWTWRDTASTFVGAPNGQGVDTLTLTNLTGSGSTVYGASQVPSLGLPLVMEFKTWPGSGAIGANRWMMGMANTVGLPYFRAWSGGYVSGTGQVHSVDPSNAPVAVGGVDPAGNQIPGTDIGVVYGQADLVVRVSRAHTAWLDTGAASQFAPAVLDPSLVSLPAGTSVQVHWRGATLLSNAPLWSSAANLDPYGDPLGGSFGVGFLNGDAGWTSDLGALSGARYVQARITLVANAATSITPRLSSLGLAFVQ